MHSCSMTDHFVPDVLLLLELAHVALTRPDVTLPNYNRFFPMQTAGFLAWIWLCKQAGTGHGLTRAPKMDGKGRSYRVAARSAARGHVLGTPLDRRWNWNRSLCPWGPRQCLPHLCSRWAQSMHSDGHRREARRHPRPPHRSLLAPALPRRGGAGPGTLPWGCRSPGLKRWAPGPALPIRNPWCEALLKGTGDQLGLSSKGG